MSMIALLHGRLHGASTKSRLSLEERSLGTLSILPPTIRRQIWRYATLGFPIKLHDINDPPELPHSPSFLDRLHSLVISYHPHEEFPFLSASKQIEYEAKVQLYKHSYNITFTMTPPQDIGRIWSDIGTPVFVGDTHSIGSKPYRVEDSDIEKTDFARFARVTFIVLGPDAKARDWSTAKMEEIKSLIFKAVIPSNMALREQRLRELVVRFENQEGWVWRRDEDLRKLNDHFRQLTYGVDGETTKLTEDNARGSLEQCLDIFRCLHDVEQFVVELPSTIDLDDRLFRFITKGSRAYVGGHDHTIVKSADGKVHVFEYKEGEFKVQRKELLPLDENDKEPWKLYEVRNFTGIELGGG